MKRFQQPIYYLLACAFLSGGVSVGLMYYLCLYRKTESSLFATRLTHVGFVHPIPAETRWNIPDHLEANYPQTIIGYEPQLFLRAREQGGYEIFFYANPRREGVHYMVRVSEITSGQAVEFDDAGRALELRSLSGGIASWDIESTRLPLQQATPITKLIGNNDAPYVICVEILDQLSHEVISSVDYLVIGNQ